VQTKASYIWEKEEGAIMMGRVDMVKYCELQPYKEGWQYCGKIGPDAANKAQYFTQPKVVPFELMIVQPSNTSEIVNLSKSLLIFFSTCYLKLRAGFEVLKNI
jgi:hypothetical protein